MNNLKNPIVIGGAIAAIIISFLTWNYIQAIKEKNAIERERIESTERLKRSELEQDQAQAEEKQKLEQAKLDRELEADCQKQITGLRSRYNNIENGGYNTEYGYCEVSYKDTKTGKIESSDVKDMVSVP